MNELITACPNCGTNNRIPGDKLTLQPKCGRCRALFHPLSGGSVIELNDASFQQVTTHPHLPVLVDFYSPTCGPCQSLAPVMSNIAQRFTGKAIITKLDTSQHQMSASRFQIRGVPTLIFFKKGQAVDQLVGAAPQPEIEQRLSNLL
jgi:thioredoxin 2